MLRTTYPASLATFLNTGAPYQRVEMWTFNLQAGIFVRIMDHEWPLTRADGVTFAAASANTPIIRRTSVKQQRGLQVSTLDLTLSAKPDQYVFGSVPWLTALAGGSFDYAEVTLDVAVLGLDDPKTCLGYYNLFTGAIATVPEIGLLSAQLQAKNQLNRLTVLMPRNTVQPGCLNTFGDRACGIDATAHTQTGTVASVGGDGSLTLSLAGGAPADGAYNEGRLVITNGDNQNVVRKIAQNVGAVFTLFAPCAFPLTAGTTLKVTKSCAKTVAACTAYGNLVNFRGYPYVPTPETVL